MSAVRWWAYPFTDERSAPPSPKDIAKAVKAVKKMPSLGDADHVQPVFPVHGTELPPVDPSAWANAPLKMLKLKRMHASNGQLARDNLIWHIQHPFAAKDPSGGNAHPQVLKTGGDLVIIGGHHRLAALQLLGVKKAPCYTLSAKDLDKDGKLK